MSELAELRMQVRKLNKENWTLQHELRLLRLRLEPEPGAASCPHCLTFITPYGQKTDYCHRHRVKLFDR